jgi:hypothetical protein
MASGSGVMPTEKRRCHAGRMDRAIGRRCTSSSKGDLPPFFSNLFKRRRAYSPDSSADSGKGEGDDEDECMNQKPGNDAAVQLRARSLVDRTDHR